jgi:nucleotide-binding universal stress UspA family protein
MSSERAIRVLVTFDCTHPNERVLSALVRLLGAVAVDVTGLYVEDEDLLRAASLPGLREISLSGKEATLDIARIVRDVAREAASAQRSFESLARRLASEHERLQHHFLVARGRIAEEMGRAALEADLVVVTRALRPSFLRPRLARAYEDLVRQSRQVLFVNEPWASGTSVVVLHGSDAALAYGARLAAAEGLRLVLAAPPGEAVDTAGLPRAPTVRHLADWEEETIAELCLSENARLLVMGARADLDWQELLLSLADRIPCSLLKLS